MTDVHLCSKKGLLFALLCFHTAVASGIFIDWGIGINVCTKIVMTYRIEPSLHDVIFMIFCVDGDSKTNLSHDGQRSDADVIFQ